MKQTIRKGVFETNSSSVHALIVPKKYDAKELEERARLIDGTIEAGEFGWGYDEYTDAYSILSYIWTGVGTSGRNKLHELFPNVKFSLEGFDEGYVDHQSADLPFHLLEQDSDQVRNIVFNGKLIISNDNRDSDGIEYDTSNEDIYW